MAIRCEKRDMDLLMLQHDGMSWWKRLWIKLHVAGCRSCRERQTEFRSVSQVLAESVGGAVPSNGYLVVQASRRMPWRSALVLGLLLLTLGACAAVWYEATNHDPLPAPAVENCQPILKSPAKKGGKQLPHLQKLTPK